MNKPFIEHLTQALHASWDADTCFDAREWTADNPARGQCVVSSLVAQDYLGGDLLRYHVTEDKLDEKHYCNVLDDGTIVDTTGLQYDFPVNLRLNPVELGTFTSIRSRCLADEDTRGRYNILKSRVAAALSDTARTEGES